MRDKNHNNRAPARELSEAERLRSLKILDEIMARPPTRRQSEVDDELRELRRARRHFWSRSARSSR